VEAMLAAITEEQIDDVFGQIFDFVCWLSVADQAYSPNANAMLEWVSDPHHVNQVDTDILLSILRLTCRNRAALSHWDAALSSVRCELEYRKEDVPALLHGLLDD
jgi:hypothetical protein